MRRTRLARFIGLAVAAAALALPVGLTGCQDDDSSNNALLAMTFLPGSAEPEYDGTNYVWDFVITIAELNGENVQLGWIDWVSYLEDDSVLFTASYDCATLAAYFAMPDCYLPGHGSYTAADVVVWPYSDYQRLVGTLYGVDEDGNVVSATAQFEALPPSP